MKFDPCHPYIHRPSTDGLIHYALLYDYTHTWRLLSLRKSAVKFTNRGPQLWTQVLDGSSDLHLSPLVPLLLLHYLLTPHCHCPCNHKLTFRCYFFGYSSEKIRSAWAQTPFYYIVEGHQTATTKFHSICDCV